MAGRGLAAVGEAGPAGAAGSAHGGYGERRRGKRALMEEEGGLLR